MTAYIKVGLPDHVIEHLKATADREHRSVANLTGAILIRHLVTPQAPPGRPETREGE